MVAGLIDKIDPLVARTYFWWFGHPLMYFWLLPACVIWCLCFRKWLAAASSAIRWPGWRSSCSWCCPHRWDSITSSPTRGSPPAGSSRTIMTYAVVCPSFVTAFTVIASLEVAGG